MPTVRTNGIRTYYEEYGDGPPVVFVHGAFGDHRLWAAHVAPLADDYRLITYDLRGHGRTGGSAPRRYSLDLFADDLAALVGGLGLDSPVVCGLSMGGWVAQRYAARRPDALAGLCTLGAISPEILSPGEWFERRVWLRAIGVLSAAFGDDRVLPVVARLDAWRDDDEWEDDPEKRARIREAQGSVPEMTSEEIGKIRRVTTSYHTTTTRYGSVGVPSLFMYGEHESASAARHAAHMADTVPDGRAREIPDAGHNSHADNPRFVVEALREFLAECYRGSPEGRRS